MPSQLQCPFSVAARGRVWLPVVAGLGAKPGVTVIWSCSSALTGPEMDVKSLLRGRVKGCHSRSERKLCCTNCTDCVIRVRMRIINLDYSLSQLI